MPGRIRLGVVAGALVALSACHHGGSDSPPTPSPRVAASLAFSVQPGPVAAGALFAPAVEVAVLDANGDLVATPTSVSVALAGGEALQGAVSAVAVDGHATFADLSIRKAGTGYTLTASSEGLLGATSAAFDVRAAAPDAAASEFVATPTTVAAGGQVALAVTLRDAYGNGVPGAEVGFEATGTANSFVQPVASTSAAGLTSGTLTSTKAEAKTLTARSGAVILVAHPVVTFTAAAADPAGSTLAASPASAPCDGTAITLTVTVADPYGNPLAGQAVTFEASGAASVVQPASATTAAGTATGTVSALVAGTQTISAKVGGTVVAQRDVTFHAMVADAAASTLAAAPARIPADGATTATITVTVRDDGGRPIPGMTVALAAAPVAAIDHATAATDAAGVAVFQASATAVGDVTFTATVTNGTAPVVVAQRATVSFTMPVAARVTVTGAGGASTINTVGGTLQLSAVVAPAAAAQGVTWSSSAPEIVSVDAATGLATSHATGQAVIVATATDGSNARGALPVSCVNNVAIFVRQTASGAAASATLSAGTIAASAAYGNSGNAFKFSGGGYYGTDSNGFVALPYALAGDFTLSATVSVTKATKSNSACGIGLGVTTGFTKTDRYAYALLGMPASNTATTAAGSARYVNGAASVYDDGGSGSPTFSYTPTATTVQVTFARTGADYTIVFSGGGSTATKKFAATALTDGTTVFGTGALYPALSFNNVNANVTAFTIKDGAGNALFDASTGSLIPGGTLALAQAQASVTNFTPATVVATAATSIGGGATTISASVADPSIADPVVAGTAITLTLKKPGNTTLTVTNDGDYCPATRTRKIPVYALAFNATDGYGTLTSYPAQNATDAYNDGELALTFDAPPVLNPGGVIEIHSHPSGALVDQIFYASEAQTVAANTTINVGSQLVRVAGNTLYVTPHFGKLAYGGSYYVAIPTTAIAGVLNGQTFTGFADQASVATWRFTVRSAPTLTATITVDPSSAAADFRSLGGALMYLATHPIAGAAAVTINVAPGTYTELAHYRPTAASTTGLTVTIRGQTANPADTVVQYTNGNSMNGTQNLRSSFYFKGAHLVLENLTLKNTGVRAQVAQAEALYFDGAALPAKRGAGQPDVPFNVAAHNCAFISRQDTVNTSGNAWIHRSYVEGNTDFIWGTSDVALVEDCDLHVVNDGSNQTFALFVARTGAPIAPGGSGLVGKGYVLLNSRVSVDAGLAAVFGRNASGSGFYDQVAIVGSTFSGPGQLGSGLWTMAPSPLAIGDSTYVGWKAADNKGLAAGLSGASGTASTIADQANQYDTRDHILNRVISVSGTTLTYVDLPVGGKEAWNVSSLATAWGAP
jgi:adhesin/invasin